jgi:hypothetical protein
VVVVREQYDIDRANLIGTEHRPHGFGKAIPATAIVVARAIESGVGEQPQTAEFEDHGRPPRTRARSWVGSGVGLFTGFLQHFS